MSVCMCMFPGCAGLKEQVFRPPPPVLSLTSLIDPADTLSSVLFSLSVFAVLSLHLLAQSAGRKAPAHLFVPVPRKSRYRLNRSRMENSDGADSQTGSWKTWLHVVPPLLAVSSVVPPASALPNAPSSCAIPHSCLRLPVKVN